MPNAIRGIVQDHGWIMLAIGLRGSTLFICGSVVSLPAFAQLLPTPVQVSTCAAALMLIGVLGPLRVSLAVY